MKDVSLLAVLTRIVSVAVSLGVGLSVLPTNAYPYCKCDWEKQKMINGKMMAHCCDRNNVCGYYKTPLSCRN